MGEHDEAAVATNPRNEFAYLNVKIVAKIQARVRLIVFGAG